MQTVIETVSTSAGIDQVDAKQAINAYLQQVLGALYRAGDGQLKANGDWRFLILFHSSELKRPWATGTVVVDGQHGAVIPLTDEQLQEVREQALVAMAESHRELPLMDGYVPQVFARRKANEYLSHSVGFFLMPVDGILVLSTRPVWQFSIQFRLPRTGPLGILGSIDVNAQTGEVLPLTTEQIAAIQGQANALARSQTQPTAA
jgi:hypothetical protein